MSAWEGRACRRAVVLGVAVLGFAWADTSWADEAALSGIEASDAQAAVARASARASMVRGDEALEGGRYFEALEAYRVADRLVRAPTTALALGRAHLALGRLVEAQDALLRAARHPVDDASPEAYVRASEDAARLVRELEPRLPALDLHVSPPAARPALRIDGVPIPMTGSETILRLDPGAHRVEVSAPGYEEASRSITVAERDRRRMRVELPRRLVLADVPTATWIASGVVGTALVTGTVTGLASYFETRSLRDRCPATTCDASLQADYERAHALARVSNVSFIVGAVGLATGLLSLLQLPTIEHRTVKVDVSLEGVRVRAAF